MIGAIRRISQSPTRGGKLTLNTRHRGRLLKNEHLLETLKNYKTIGSPTKCCHSGEDGKWASLSSSTCARCISIAASSKVIAGEEEFKHTFVSEVNNEFPQLWMLFFCRCQGTRINYQRPFPRRTRELQFEPRGLRVEEDQRARQLPRSGHRDHLVHEQQQESPESRNLFLIAKSAIVGGISI